MNTPAQAERVPGAFERFTFYGELRRGRYCHRRETAVKQASTNRKSASIMGAVDLVGSP
jgi:hypothetical protein